LTNLDAALKYAALGWLVLPLHTPTGNLDQPCSCRKTECPQKGKHPCHSNSCKEKGNHPCHQSVCGNIGKHPRTINGVDDATTDDAKIREWWDMWPDANVAIVAGKESGFFVLDSDPRNGGDVSLSELESTHGDLKQTRAQETGGDGMHLLFKHPGFRIKGSKGELGAGLDIKGDGGYIVVAPSLHASGKRYKWRDSQPIAEAPGFLLERLRETEQKQYTNGRPGEFTTWDALRAECGRRIIALGSGKPNSSGNYDCRGICHNGKGDTGLFYNPATNWPNCNDGCDLSTILRAFNLPEKPVSARRRAQVDDVEPDQAQLAEPSQPDPIITKTLLNNTLTLELWQADRGKVKLDARAGDLTLHRDVLSLDREKDRKDFVKALDLKDEAMDREVHKALLEIGDQLGKTPKPQTGEEKDIRRVISAELPDGRLIEQISGAQFAVYNPKTRDVVYKPQVEVDGVLYLPLNDPMILTGDLHLPTALVPYTDEQTLVAEIEACIRRYSCINDRDTKISVHYVLMSYLVDHLLEVLYLRTTGKPGSGKTRYVVTVGMLCLRPLLVIDPSAASLYRMMDAYKPTLIVDECNFEKGSEDSGTLMKVLNSGNQRITKVPRAEKGGESEFVLRAYSAFGPKLIGSLTYSGSRAFESRCWPVESTPTSNPNIKFRMTKAMFADFAALRQKLYMWRFHNYHKDYEEILDRAERELRAGTIEPRAVQISIPLYGLINDQKVKDDYLKTLEARSENEAEDRRATRDGKLITIIHGILFEITKSEDGSEEKAKWRAEIKAEEIVEGEPYELLSVEEITKKFNDGIKKKKWQRQPNTVGGYLGALGLRRRRRYIKKSPTKGPTSVVWEWEKLTNLFTDLRLPYLPAISSDRSDRNPTTASQSTTYTRSDDGKTIAQSNGDLTEKNANNDNGLGSFGQMGQMNFQEHRDGNNSEEDLTDICHDCGSPLDTWGYCANCEGAVPF
jgi:Bifunctional DNA primase/polymerase, N-terminal